MYETVQPLLARPTGPGGLTPMSALLPLFLAALSEAGLNIYTSPGGELVNLTVCWTTRVDDAFPTIPEKFCSTLWSSDEKRARL